MGAFEWRVQPWHLAPLLPEIPLYPRSLLTRHAGIESNALVGWPLEPVTPETSRLKQPRVLYTNEIDLQIQFQMTWDVSAGMPQQEDSKATGGDNPNVAARLTSLFIPLSANIGLIEFGAHVRCTAYSANSSWRRVARIRSRNNQI